MGSTFLITLAGIPTATEYSKILFDYRSCPNSATVTNSDAWEDSYICSKPAVITDGDWLSILDIASSRLQTGLMCRSDEANTCAERKLCRQL